MSTSKSIANALRDWAYKTIVVKIGGAAADDDRILAELKKDFAALRTSKTRVALVHGASKQIAAQFPDPVYVDGLRVTSPQMIDALPGIHEKIANKIERAISDENETFDTRAYTTRFFARPRETPLQAVGRIYSTNVAGIMEGFVIHGDPGLRAICSPLAHNPIGQPKHLNVNADEAAAHLAQALRADALIFLAEEDGVLDDNGEVIRRITDTTDRDAFKKGRSFKVASASAAAHDIKCVRIAPVHQPSPVLSALSEDFKGTEFAVETIRTP